jgi:hypothetical protein
MATTTTMTDTNNNDKQFSVQLVRRSRTNEIFSDEIFNDDHNDDDMIYECEEKKKKCRTIVGEVLEDIVSAISILPSSSSSAVGSDDDDGIITEGKNNTNNYHSTPSTKVQVKESSHHRESRNDNRDVVLFGVNTNRNDNRNLKEIIKYNYKRFYHQAQTSQERIMIVEQIVLAVLSNNGRFIKLIRNNNNVGGNGGGSRFVHHRNSIEKEVHVVDFNTARDRIIQIFQNTTTVSSF